MTFTADLHTHSPFARGTSRQLTFENLASCARTKGIDLLSTGDFTHPRWLAEARSKLREADSGLLALNGTRFILGTEVCCSAVQDGRRRRVHILVFAPDFRAVDLINRALAEHGKLESDGRPTLDLTPRDLLQRLLDVDERCFIIPAHLWTPHFGLYGARSGFDSLEECFGDLAQHVSAVETGLSSEPAMNWRVPSLDAVSLVSFSDAHSLPNLGRELTVFQGRPSYAGLVDALRNQGIEHTFEFFPQEGKYHLSGHRKCGTSLSPAEPGGEGARCPKCGGKLTQGVLQRVEELSGREGDTWLDGEGFTRAGNGRPPFKMLFSMRHIVAQAVGHGPDTKGVRSVCSKLISSFGSELSVLTEAAVSDIARAGGERVAEGVARMRAGDVTIEAGYDGQYGKVSIWPADAQY